MTGLDAFRDPASIAVVGASATPTKWGYWLARGALTGIARRTVHLVNARGGAVLGQRTARSLRELPGAPELVAFAVPGPALGAAVDEALALGARGLLAITAGVEDERVLAARVRGAGARLIGPNCLGIYDASAELYLVWGQFRPGSLAIVSQSGQLGLELAGLAADAGLGISRFVSVGSQADVTAHEVLTDLAGHDATRVVALYLESFGDGHALIAALTALRRAGKPVLLLTVGASDAGRQAARSHTGAMTTATDIVDAACETAGAVRAETPARLIAAAQLLVRAPRPTGRRVVVVTDSGGQGALAADLASRAGLLVEPLPQPTRHAVATGLPPQAATANPVDLAGGGEQDLRAYGRVVDLVAASGGADAVLMSGYFGSYGRDIPAQQELETEVALELARSAIRHGLPVLVHSMARSTTTTEALRAAGVPTYEDIETAVGALGTAARLAERGARERVGPEDVAGDERTPHAGEADTPPVADVRTPPAAEVRTPRAAGTGVRTSAAPPTAFGYLSARALLAGAGVAFPPAVPVTDLDELRGAADRLTAPYVLKADWLEHKSEHGGVAVGLGDATALEAAYMEMSLRLGPGRYVVEELDRRPHVVEMVVATRRDPSFGPVVVVGAGGTETELRRDSALALAPCTHQDALTLIARLRCAPLLDGWRGRPPADIGALADTVVRLSRLAAARPDLPEIELNPVRVAPDGLLAVDALITLTGAAPAGRHLHR
ncbi:acetate--CoA ligase family protein [Streptomyces sp. NBC_01197]|uniref:acetate--CoA ligase family protein n=1 Tax=Streptomyces sp. NBC_01197 TaxID=2903768 RepID=UPI002E13DE32|nr:acetate--CoA ligase family protein [Streptomyces sp. NBC_01197]